MSYISRGSTRRARATARMPRWAIRRAARLAAVLGLVSSMFLAPAAAHANDPDVNMIPGTATISWNKAAVNLTTSDPNNALVFGTMSMVPGDIWRRTGVAMSAAPTANWLMLSIDHVDPGTMASSLFQELEFAWSIGGFEAGTVKLSEAATGACSMIGAPVLMRAGSTAPVTFDLIYPLDATNGNQASAGPETVVFDLNFRALSADNPRPTTGACGTGVAQWLIDGGLAGTGGHDDIIEVDPAGPTPWDTLLSLTGGSNLAAGAILGIVLIAFGGACFVAYHLLYRRGDGEPDPSS